MREAATDRPEKLLDVVLRRTFYLCGIAFLVAGTWLGWRVVVLTQRIEARLEALDARVAALGEGVTAARQRTAAALQLDDLALLLSAVREARESPELDDGTPAEVEAEIDLLLAAVRAWEHGFVCDGEPCAAFSLHARLYSKRLVHGDRLATTENFIDRVASRSLSGQAYQVTQPDGAEPVDLADWLRARLTALRTASSEP